MSCPRVSWLKWNMPCFYGLGYLTRHSQDSASLPERPERAPGLSLCTGEKDCDMKNITRGRRKAIRKARVLFQVFLFSILLFVPSFLLSLPLFFFFLSPLSLLFLPSQLFLPLWPRLPLNLQSCPHPCSAGITSTHHHSALLSSLCAGTQLRPQPKGVSR